MSEGEQVGDLALLAWRHGRLSAADRAGIEKRIVADPAAQATLSEWDRQDAALAALYDPVAAESVPDRLRAMMAEARAAEVENAPDWRQRLDGAARVAGAFALLAIGVTLGWTAARIDTPAAPTAAPPAYAALRAHETYAVEVAHPVEVGADQSEHLVKWLSKRLDHPIAAPDFARFGFRLIGGRLLPGDRGAAAVLMYQDDAGHRLTLYVTPQPGDGETAFSFVEDGAAQGFWWVEEGFGYAVVGAVPREVLREIATAAYDQLT